MARSGIDKPYKCRIGYILDTILEKANNTQKKLIFPSNFHRRTYSLVTSHDFLFFITEKFLKFCDKTYRKLHNIITLLYRVYSALRKLQKVRMGVEYSSLCRCLELCHPGNSHHDFLPQVGKDSILHYLCGVHPFLPNRDFAFSNRSIINAVKASGS